MLLLTQIIQGTKAISVEPIRQHSDIMLFCSLRTQKSAPKINCSKSKNILPTTPNAYFQWTSSNHSGICIKDWIPSTIIPVSTHIHSKSSCNTLRIFPPNYRVSLFHSNFTKLFYIILKINSKSDRKCQFDNPPQ